jgi:hypothetical protein
MIETVFRLGDDALDNQGEIVITPIAIFGQEDPIRMRITSFDIPEFAVGSYEVNYKTQKFTKPTGRVSETNAFTFSFRADKYWAIYNALLAWKMSISNDRTGVVSEDVSISGASPYRTDFTVMVRDSAGVVTNLGWQFTHAFIKSLGSISFDNASDGQPITVSVTLEYVQCFPLAVQ